MRVVPPSRRKTRSCNLTQVFALDRNTPGERIPAEAYRQDEQPRAPVLAALGIAHHGAGTIIHLCFFTGFGENHRFESGSVVGSLAGFAGGSLPQSPGGRTAKPTAFK